MNYFTAISATPRLHSLKPDPQKLPFESGTAALAAMMADAERVRHRQELQKGDAATTKREKTEQRVLGALSNAEGQRATLHELAKAALVSYPTARSVMKQFERQGVVQHVADRPKEGNRPEKVWGFAGEGE